MINTYRVGTVGIDGHTALFGNDVKHGTPVQMTPEQAKYLLLAGIVEPHPLDHDGDGKLGGRRRRKAVAKPEPDAEPAGPAAEASDE